MNYDENSIYRPGRAGLRKLLGDLELEVMEVVWEAAVGVRLTVRQVFETLAARKQIAYTTVMTTMARLADKGILQVEKASPSHLYYVEEGREGFTKRAVGKLLDDLLVDFAEPALGHLAESLSQGMASRLADLEQQIRAQRTREEADASQEPGTRPRAR